MNEQSSRHKTFGYGRVGSANADGYHQLTHQIYQLMNAGVEEQNLLLDIGSANAERRPGLEKLIQSIHEGCVDEVLVARLDRLFRRPSDFITFKKLLDNFQVNLRILNFSNRSWQELSAQLNLQEEHSHE